ncbi:30S ribosomal protein S4 [Acidobacteria bacterium AH-259-A15]|nr:30S ribosomal protein S4 [Acidobacteria bacterium AH-259-A15]
MARYIGPVCRLCRREGMKLFLKGQRCYGEKCAIEKRNFLPGEHGRNMRIRRKVLGYGLQLREKQRVKRIYGVLENQFRCYFEKAARKKGITGELLLQFLERRLDNIVYRLGFAGSRKQARQLVRHSHILVNDRKVTIPSYLISKGDEISIREKSQKNEMIRSNVEEVVGRGVPSWLVLDNENFKGQVLELPRREDITIPVEEALIVELYSK